MDRSLQFVRAVICDSSDLLSERGRAKKLELGRKVEMRRDQMR